MKTGVIIVQASGSLTTPAFQLTTSPAAGRILLSDASGNGAWTAIGATTQVIYNSSGSLTGNAAFTYNVSTSTLLVTSVSSSAIFGTTTTGVGVFGSASGSGQGITATSLSGQAAVLEQLGALTGSISTPTVLIARAHTLGAFTSTGPILQVVDNTAATGPLIRCEKQGVVKAILDNDGLLGLGNGTPTFGLHQFGGCMRLAAVAPPTPTVIAQTGTSGTTSYFYWIMVEDRVGFLTLPGTSRGTTTSNATLSGTNFNVITFPTAAGAAIYHILRTTTSVAPTGSGLFKVGAITETGAATYAASDQSNTVTTFTVPTRNLTADFTGDGLITSTVTRSDGPAVYGINNGGAAGVRGDALGTGSGVNGTGFAGAAGSFSTTGTLLASTTLPVISASRQNVISSFDMTGPIAYLEDLTTSSGDFITCIKSGVLQFGVTKSGLLRGDSVAGLPVCGRLSLSSGNPVTIADQTSGSLFYSPFRGNTIPLYNTALSTWDLVQFTTLSASLSGGGANNTFDVFIVGNNAGGSAIQFTTWTNNTTRATALTLQDGVLVLTGFLNWRYVGTIRMNSSGTTASDTIQNRNLWNYYNRVARRWHCFDPTITSYTIAATGTSIWQFCRATASTCQGSFVLGVVEDLVDFHFSGSASVATAAYYGTGINIAQGTTGAPTPTTTSIIDHGFRTGGNTAAAEQVGAHGHFQFASTTVGYFLVTKLEYGENGVVTVLPTSNTGTGTYQEGGMNCFIMG